MWKSLCKIGIFIFVNVWQTLLFKANGSRVFRRIFFKKSRFFFSCSLSPCSSFNWCLHGNLSFSPVSQIHCCKVVDYILRLFQGLQNPTEVLLFTLDVCRLCAHLFTQVSTLVCVPPLSVCLSVWHFVSFICFLPKAITFGFFVPLYFMVVLFLLPSFYFLQVISCFKISSNLIDAYLIQLIFSSNMYLWLSDQSLSRVRLFATP